MAAKLLIEVVAPTRTGLELWRSRVNFTDKVGIAQLTRMLGEMSSSEMPNVCRVTIDDTTGVSATNTIIGVYASLTAADTFSIIDPTGKAYTFVCSTSAVTLGDLTFRKVTDNTATGTSIAAQINAYPGLKGILTASSTTGTVTITMTAKGVGGNLWGLKKGASNGSASAFTLGAGTFSGGISAGTVKSATFTLTDVGTANDTLSIGGQTLTLVASAANENQVTIGGTAGATATAIAAAINAHTKLKGLVLASASGTSTGIVTMTLQLSGRIGLLVSLLKSCSVGTLSATSFAPSTTEAWAASVVTLKNGAVAG